MSTRPIRAPLTILLVLLVTGMLAACGAAGDDPTDGGTIDQCELGEADPGFSYPLGPYGSTVNEVFEDFELEDCDGEPVRFGDLLARSELVLFNVGAGWCQPCIDETRTLQQEIVGPFCQRGLAVVQVLFQDEAGRPATKLFCDQWREEFGLSIPVLVDPLFVTQRYFEATQTPLNMLVDGQGIIRYKQIGIAPADLAERIDGLLPR